MCLVNVRVFFFGRKGEWILGDGSFGYSGEVEDVVRVLGGIFLVCGKVFIWVGVRIVV